MRTPQRQNNSKLAKGLNLMRNKSSIVEKGNKFQAQARCEIFLPLYIILIHTTHSIEFIYTTQL